MSDHLGGKARSILESARDGEPSLDDCARIRMRKRLLASVAASAAAATVTTSPGSAGAGSAGGASAGGASGAVAKTFVAGGIAKSLVVVALIAGVATTGYLVGRRPDVATVAALAGAGTTPAHTKTPATAPPAQREPVPTIDPAMLPDVAPATPHATGNGAGGTAKRTERRTSPAAVIASPSALVTKGTSDDSAPPSAPPTSGPGDAFSRDLAVVDRARAALAHGDPNRALAELDSGCVSAEFKEERAALRGAALCAAGRMVEGKLELLRFVEAFPRSVHEARIRRACTEP